MQHGALADDRPFAHGAEEVRLQFDGRESRGVVGLVGEGPVATACIGERHDARGVQIAVRRHEFFANVEPGSDAPGTKFRYDEPDQAGHQPGGAGVEPLDGEWKRCE